MEKPQEQLERQFIEAYDAHMDAIFRYCFFKTNDRELAKDLMQQTFAKAWEYMQNLANSSAENSSEHEIRNIRAFLYKTAGNMVIDWYRKRKEQSLDTMQDEGFDPADNHTESQTDHRAEIEWMRKALDQLEPDDKDLIIWNYLDDIPYSEIAEILGEKPTTISVRIYRAIKRLKKILHAEEHTSHDQ